MAKLSHIDSSGNINMVDISQKTRTVRTAVAEGMISMQPETVKIIIENKTPKGNVLTTASVAGIQAAKKVPELIPLCHQIDLSWIDVRFKPENDGFKITSTAKADYTTGVEMEALTATSVAALTIYDMCKAVDKNMVIGPIRLTEKTGGKSE